MPTTRNEKTDSNLAAVTDDLLLQCASEAGTVADRATLALSIADEAFARFGRDAVQADLLLEGVTIDRVVSTDHIPFVALMIARATDKLTEVNLARQVTTARGAINREWPDCELIVVSVGYSSAEVRALQGRTLIFEDVTFQGLLETEITRVAAARRRQQATAVGPSGPQGPPGQADPELRGLLERVSRRLDDLETERTSESARIDRQLAAETAVLAAPTRQEQELKTRWDMVGALDRLEEDLRSNRIHSEGELLGRMRAILVANETFRSDPVVDQLGGAFLDIVSLGGSSDMLFDLIFNLRRALRSPGGLRVSLRRYSPLSEIAIGLLTAILVWSPASTVLNMFVPVIALALAAGVGLIVGLLVRFDLRRTNPTTYWTRRVDRLREERGTRYAVSR